jgi:hypothetical protein
MVLLILSMVAIAAIATTVVLGFQYYRGRAFTDLRRRRFMWAAISAVSLIVIVAVLSHAWTGAAVSH